MNLVRASKVQNVLNQFNFSLFNITSVRLMDNRMLPLEIREKYPNQIDEAKLVGRIKKEMPIEVDKTARSNVFQSCVTTYTSVDWWWDPDGIDDPCHCSGNEVYSYTVTTPTLFCFEIADNSTPFEYWWTGSTGFTNGSGSPGGTGTTEQQLNDMLEYGDSYEYYDPMQPQSLIINDDFTYNSVNQFANSIQKYSFDASTEFQDGDTKVQRARINRTFIGGYDFHITLEKNTLNIFEVQNVTSDMWGNNLGWDFVQSAYSKTISGNIITVDITGKERWLVVFQSVGIVYSKAEHFQIKVDKTTGLIKSITHL